MPTLYLQRKWTDDHQFLGRVAGAVNRLLQGAHNEVHDITMNPGAPTTVFPANALGVPPDLLPRITPSTVCVLTPVHLNAANLMYNSAWGPLYLHYVSNVGYVTFTHGATGLANQDFKLLLFGD